MKISFLKLLLIVLLVTSCNSLLYKNYSPEINYLGNKYSTKKDIEVFFDKNDISHPYKIMGIMKSESNLYLNENLVNEIKKKMIERSKTYGAEAILFEKFYKETRKYEKSIVMNDESKIGYNTYTIVEAKLIKYIE